MDKYILPEGEAHLLVAVFEHLGEYRERAKENDTSVSDELSKSIKNLTQYAEAVRRAIGNCLIYHEREVIKRRYILSPYTERSTREEIARDFETTCKRIRKVEARALQKVRRHVTELTSKEERAVIEALEEMKIEQLGQASRAERLGDLEAASEYIGNYSIYKNAINKLRIQQDIRKYREKTE